METAEIKNSLGTIRISDQVIASIAQAATLHVKGIYAMDDRFSHAISSVINDEETRGIRVSIDNKSIVVDLYVAVYHVDRIPAIALNLQEIVKEEILDSAGIRVTAVNVNVQKVVFDKER